MLAAGQRISRGSDFSRTLGKGARVHTRHLIVHVAPVPRRWPDPSGMRADVATCGGPRLGLIVSKKTGHAVTRHRVARRLRAAFAVAGAELPDPEVYVVARVKPGVTHASVAELTEQFRSAFDHPKVRRAFSSVWAGGRSE